MEVSVKITGLNHLNELTEKMYAQAAELRETIAEINRAATELSMEINQPTAGTID